MPGKKDKDGKTSPKRSSSNTYRIKDFRNNSSGNKVDFTIFLKQIHFVNILLIQQVLIKMV